MANLELDRESNPPSPLGGEGATTGFLGHNAQFGEEFPSLG